MRGLEKAKGVRNRLRLVRARLQPLDRCSLQARSLSSPAGWPGLFSHPPSPGLILFHPPDPPIALQSITRDAGLTPRARALAALNESVSLQVPGCARYEDGEDGDSRNRQNGSNKTEHERAAHEPDDHDEGMELHCAPEHERLIDRVLHELGH